MTKELKALMERESDRPDHYFAPDPAAILAAGRRRSRVRNLTAGTTVLTALVVLVAGAILVLPKQQDAPVAGLPTRAQDAYKQCDTSNGRRLGKDSWAWPEIVTLMDDEGSASLRRDPADPNRVAYCVTQRAAVSDSLPPGGDHGIMLRITPVDTQRSVVTVFGRTYTGDGGTVMVVFGKNSRVLMPANLKVKSLSTAAATVGQAKITGTYYALRIIQPIPWPGERPQVTVASYRQDGVRINIGTW
jgi:hypothetical protein